MARGWCAKHYARWRTHGDPLKVSVEKSRRGAPMEFIVQSVSFEGEECLIWPFNRDKKTGVAQISIKRSTTNPARVVCTVVHGPAPSPEHHAAHSCGNSHLGCINPKHVRWATPAENEADKRAHGTAPIGAAHGSAKITDEIAIEIIRSDESLSAVGARFGISHSTAGKIRRREIWKHLG